MVAVADHGERCFHRALGLLVSHLLRAHGVAEPCLAVFEAHFEVGGAVGPPKKVEIGPLALAALFGRKCTEVHAPTVEIDHFVFRRLEKLGLIEESLHFAELEIVVQSKRQHRCIDQGNRFGRRGAGSKKQGRNKQAVTQLHARIKEGLPADVKRRPKGDLACITCAGLEMLAEVAPSRASAPMNSSEPTHYQRSLAAARETLDALGPLEEPLNRAARAVTEALISGRKLILCGNGGSSSDAAHIAAEFVCRFVGDRRPYPAMALGVDGGLLTAIGNDYDFSDAFSRQIHAFGQPGDVLIGISSSGKSRNVLAAIEEARRRGMVTVAMLGRDGGFTKGAADIELIVPGATTARIQEAQKFLLHVLCEMAEEKLPRE